MTVESDSIWESKAINYEEIGESIEKLIIKLLEHTQNLDRQRTIQEALETCLPSEGELIEPIHLSALSNLLAERMVSDRFRLDTQREISLDELLNGE